MEDGETCTDPKTPSKIAYTDYKSSLKFYDANPVISMDGSTVVNAVTAANADYRQSIVYKESGTIDLLFTLISTPIEHCCFTGITAVPNTDCAAANTACAAATPPNLILKIIANPDVITLATADSSNGDSNIYKGIYVLPHA